ncbi:MAG: hypothetical protein AABX04_06815 [Nanoarchaeota archaeon]
MATLILAIPDDLKQDLKELKVVDWPRIAREAIQQRVIQLRILKSISAKSKLTKSEAEKLSIELGRKVRSGIHEKHVAKYGA